MVAISYLKSASITLPEITSLLSGIVVPIVIVLLTRTHKNVKDTVHQLETVENVTKDVKDIVEEIQNGTKPSDTTSTRRTG